MASPSSIAAKAKRLRAGLDALIDAIERPGTASYGEGAGLAMAQHWRAVGVDLLSETGGRKQGLRLKRGAKPLMVRCFGAPIQDYIALYDKAMAFVPKAKPGSAEKRPAAGMQEGGYV